MVLTSTPVADPSHDRALVDSPGVSGRSINKLVLVMSEACNLRCRYCYVGRAGHDSARVMAPEVARRVVRTVLTDAASCGFVQFFGGEPTLALRGMEAALDEIDRMVGDGTIDAVPRVGLVTNGVWPHPERTLELLVEHSIETTVSLDGPAEIHDALRPDNRGGSTFERARGALEAAQRARLPVAIESVYTSHHLAEGFSVVDLFEFCRGLGVAKLIFDKAYPPAPPELNPLLEPYFEQLAAAFEEAVDWWFDTLVAGEERPLDVYFASLLRPLLGGVAATTPSHSCPAGAREFAIGPDGDLYGCQLLYGYPDFRIGNVLTGEFPGEAVGFPTGIADIASCGDCFARSWCQPCAGLNLYWGDQEQVPVLECQLRRRVVRRIGQRAFAALDVPDNDITRVLRDAVAAGSPI